MKKDDPSFLHEERNQTTDEIEFRGLLEDYFDKSIGSTVDKLEHFAKYVPRQNLTRFLCMYEIFKRVKNVHGSIIECGVLFGGGLMTWAQLSAIFEPVNYQRKVIGFDTFAGFTNLSKEDEGGTSRFLEEGGLAVDSYDDLQKLIGLYDKNRLLGHMPKVELVKGDVVETVPEYIKQNPHTVVSLLILDVDVYEPTKVAIEHIVPRMPKGAVIVFDQINYKQFPGETLAVLDTIGIRNLRIERFDFFPMTSFAVLE